MAEAIGTFYDVGTRDPARDGRTAGNQDDPVLSGPATADLHVNRD